MSLRDRIAIALCADAARRHWMVPQDRVNADAEWSGCSPTMREWYYVAADAILSDPEIAALREVAESVIEEVAAERDFDPASGHRDRRGAARRITAAKSRKYAALARLEEASRG